jgi:hypothetical protein
MLITLMCRRLQFSSAVRSPRLVATLCRSTTYCFPQIGFESALTIVPMRLAEIGEKMNQTVSTAAGWLRKRTILPVLVFLFVISYGLLTMLVVFQDRTIDAQTDLIHLMFKESRRLNVIAAAQKNQVSADKQRASQGSARTQTPSSQIPKMQTPSSQVPTSQNATQIPSSQEKSQASAKPGRNQHKAGRRSPFRPPSEMTDPSDMRRTLFSI